jgi:hypothetical protein
VDGTLIGTATYDYTAGFDASTDIGVGYMAYNFNPDYYYDGKLDEIALYTRALDVTEILDHWNGGAGRDYCSGTAEAPAIVSAPVLGGTVGEPYSYDVEATGNPAPGFSLNLAPAGMAIDPDSGLITWTPTAAGDFDVEVAATNAVGTDTQPFSIAVAEPAACPTDLNAFWKFDEGAGPPFVDSAGTADATCGPCPDPMTGLVDGALWFDGTDEVNAPAVGNFDWAADASFTIAYWMKTDQSTAGNRVLIGRDGDGLHMWIGCDNNGTARFQLKENGGDYVYLGGVGPVLNDDQWHHVVAVRDNDADRNALYVDQVLIDEATHDYTYGFASGAALNIGYLNLGGRYRYHGALDEITIYDKALTPEEIQHYYTLGMAGTGTCEALVPTFTSAPVTEAEAGQPYAYAASAFGNPLPVTFGLTEGPAGMTVDPATGLVEWVPAAAGTYPVILTAANAAGESTQDFTIEVVFLGGPPLITAVTDIAQDEGGRVRLVWNGSAHDAADTGVDITGYGVYRRQDGVKATNAGDKMAGWDYIDTVPARGDLVYQFVAPTLCDSTEAGICWSVFFISAMTPDPLAFFDSPVDSGYSVDNLAPPAPGAFTVAYDHLGNALTWEESTAGDVQSYLVYRGQDTAFEPQDENLVATVTRTDWYDPAADLAGDPFRFHYRVAARDSSGNLGPAVAPGEVTGATDPSLPTRFALHGNVPNPFNPLTTIRYELPRTARISLRIFDVSGRLVAVLKDNETESAGRHETVWRGQDQAGRQVAAGIYFYRMEAPSFNQTRRMVLVK